MRSASPVSDEPRAAISTWCRSIRGQRIPSHRPARGSELVASAILTRAPEISTRLGKVEETVSAVAPGLLQFVMTGAYHLFPETAGKEAPREDSGDGEISVEAAGMAYLMRGIHF